MNLKPLTDRLGVLTDPRFWHRNYPIDDDWDRALAAAMFLVEHDARPLEILNDCEVRIAGLDVWVENWPSAFGYPATVPPIKHLFFVIFERSFRPNNRIIHPL